MIISQLDLRLVLRFIIVLVGSIAFQLLVSLVQLLALVPFLFWLVQPRQIQEPELTSSAEGLSSLLSALRRQLIHSNLILLELYSTLYSYAASLFSSEFLFGITILFLFLGFIFLMLLFTFTTLIFLCLFQPGSSCGKPPLHHRFALRSPKRQCLWLFGPPSTLCKPARWLPFWRPLPFLSLLTLVFSTC